MPTHPSTSAEEARKALAGRLRELRKDAGLTLRDLAARAGWHYSKSSRIETGVTAPSDDDIRAWCRVCGAQDLTEDLIAASRTVHSMYVEWRRVQRTGLRRLQESYVPLYERTRQFRVYCSNVVPGLLQTPAYATALLSRIARFHGTPDDVADAVAARVERSRVLHHGEHRFAILVEESVLRYRVGDVETMAGQLGYLLAVMSFPAVSLGVVPFAAEREMWPVETFMVFDGGRVSVELLTAAVTVSAPSQIAEYGRAFESMAAVAVYGAKARAVITGAIEALG